MRCKFCKEKIDNEKLYRCPHCGKPIPKKKERDKKEYASLLSFCAVSAAFIILNFFSLFFSCDYYNPSMLIVALVVYLVAVPFIFGNYKGLKRSAADCIAVLLSVPFIVNWAICFGGKSDFLASTPYSAAYYFSVLISIVLIDIILILKAFGTIGEGKIAKWLCLAIGAAEMIYTFIFYARAGIVKPMAMMIISFNAFFPGFIAFHIISRDSKESLSLYKE